MIVLDKNIVIDIISGRQRKDQIIEILNNFEKFYISTHTFNTIFYILRKDYIKDEVYQYLTHLELLEINPTDCHLAYNLAQNTDDIEDCLELFTAKRNGCKIMTADKLMIQKYGKQFEVVEVG